ncbi:MAG: hypothetical protein WCJ64_14075 [Rhodospirillaceae bacterium]
MTRSFKTQLAGQIGESLVVAELGRRDIVATSFSGNVPDIDLLAYRDGKTLHLQVKAWRIGSVSVDATRFLDITIRNDIQTVNGPADGLDPTLIYVFVQIGERLGDDRFFILEQSTLQTVIQKSYQAFLDKHGGRRPRNTNTTHNAVTLEHLIPYQSNWGLIEQRFS